ncbi:MAG TPA: hypothetical protein VNI35_04190 [Nitrospira sp.]|nr:hypothetical protein [Nitrospira sp.]
MFAMPASADFKVGSSLGIDVGGKQQFEWVIAHRHAIGEFHNGKAIVEDFECGFLALSFQAMAHYEDRLAFPLDTKVTQRVLRRCGAGEVAAGTCSY